MFDATDLEILNLLQENARLSNAEIARQVGLAPSAVFERIKKLESQNVITGYTATLDPKKFQLGLVAFVFVQAEDRVSDTATADELVKLPEVLEVHNIAGEDCYLVKVRVPDTEALSRLLREKLGAIPTLKGTRTTIVLDSFKETANLPLPRIAKKKERRRA